MNDNEISYLSRPVVPFDPRAVSSVEEALVALQGCSFQGRQLGRALEVLWAMVGDEGCLKVLALAGAMVAAGMSEVVCTMVEEGMVDAIVSTGANITHDIVNAWHGGEGHYIGHPQLDDGDLFDRRINRVYDTLVPDDYYNDAREREFEVLAREYGKGPVTARPSEVFALVGKALPRRSFLKVAADNGVPVFCGATSDSDFGMMIGEKRKAGELGLVLDEVGDVVAFSELIEDHDRAGNIIVGGGVPRNWSQQVFPFLEEKGAPRPEGGRGYHYSVRIHTALEYDGGLSGCTVSESKSWGKYIKDARHASVWVDATIALPLLVTAVLQRKRRLPKRHSP
ncbi:MAG: deoxyhypusine synthase family protein [Promethearchaeota archaeon]